MTKEFVPYELAVKLKALGFDEVCFGCFNHLDKSEIWTKGTYMNGLTKNITAPLFQQAFRWFREKYGLRIRNYGSINYSKELSEYFEVFKYGYGTADKSLSIEIGALTYEDAELACLTKLIELVEQTEN